MANSLMRIFHFTEADLAANRAGKLSHEQEQRFFHQRQRLKTVILFIGILLLVVAGVFVWTGLIMRTAGQGSWWLMMFIAAPVFAVPGILCVYGGLKRMTDMFVGIIRGRVKVNRVQRNSPGSSGTRVDVMTELHIGGEIFKIPDSAFGEITDGDTYVVYYWKGVGDIFSLERIA
jgi:hypothetical protein